jgi:hypothetical protein
LKKAILKCGLLIFSSINITIWPVFQVNFSSTAFTTTATVELTLKTGGALGENSFSTTLSIPSNSIDDSPVVGNYKIANLCDVTVFPRVVEEFSVFTFAFNMGLVSKNANTGNTGNSDANEISIYFPENVFGVLFVDKVLCVIDNTILNCYWEESNLLNIYSSSFKITSTDKNLTEIKI